MTQNEKQKKNASTIKIAAGTTKAEDMTSKEKEEIQVKQTQPICTNDRSSLISQNHHDVAPQNKNKALHG